VAHGIPLREVAISTAGARNLADTRPIFPSSFVTLNVAPEKAMFGMARMFQTLASDNRPNFRVVQTMDEALKTIASRRRSLRLLKTSRRTWPDRNGRAPAWDSSLIRYADSSRTTNLRGVGFISHA